MKKINVALLGFYNNNNHIMLNKRLDAHEEMWELVGGGVEEGETPMGAIVREILEELQYEINSETDNIRHVESFKLATDKFDADVHYFKARFPGFEYFADSEETHVGDLKMFSIPEALELTLLPMTRIILEKNNG